jgi:hypothetical protein
MLVPLRRRRTAPQHALTHARVVLAYTLLILRSELSQSGIGTTVGRTRITIGADPRNPTPGGDQPVPVLEAISFEATTVSCGK